MTEQPGPGAPVSPERPFWHTVAAISLLAGVLFAFSWLVSGSVVDATIYAVFFFTGATLWTVFQLRRRRARERQLAREREPAEEQE